MSVALLFSPQGSQLVGMGRSLAEAEPAARAVFDAADRVLDWPVSDLAWNGPEERLNDTRWTQPALLTASVAAFEALRARRDPAPAFVAGHSVGEYAALVAAGVLAFHDALRLVARRGELMASVPGDGGMVAVIGLEREAVQRAVVAAASPAELVVANDNAPGQVVLSGSAAALAAADSAIARTAPESPARRTGDRLATAIRNSCYADPSRHSGAPQSATPCSDPLASWSVVLPQGAQEVANPLQNAMETAASGVPGQNATESVSY